MLTVSSVSINDMARTAEQGFRKWLVDSRSDVVCVQNFGLQSNDLAALGTAQGWYTTQAPRHGSDATGVAIFSRTQPQSARVGFDSGEFDDTGRYVEIDLHDVVIASLHLPASDVTGTPQQAEKDRFLEAFLPYLMELRARAEAGSKDVLVCGDWNLTDRRGGDTRLSSDSLAQRRTRITQIFEEAGYVDVVRRRDDEDHGNQRDCRSEPTPHVRGWRNDHIATEWLTQRALDVVVDSPPPDADWAEHAPVTVRYDF